MAITPLAPLDRTSPTFRTDVDNFFGSAIPAFVGQANALAANLNSIAAGGAYAIPYKFSAGTGDVGDAGPGYFRLNNAAQSSATTLRLDASSSAGVWQNPVLSTFNISTSQEKGIVRLVKMSDPTKWMILRVAGNGTAPTWFWNFPVTVIDSSGTNPFADGDAVMLHFQRTGDKGDASTLTPVLWVRDEKASGVAGGSGIPDGYVVRTLNTAKKNSMSGASLAGNQITLPAGTFRVSFTAPAGPTASNHKAYLYNVTDGVTTVAGTSTYAPQSAQIVTVSQVLCAEFTISSSKVFEVRHWITATGTPNLGAASSSGQVEVYTDVFIEKVS